jgi:hypothetical protein
MPKAPSRIPLNSAVAPYLEDAAAGVTSIINSSPADSALPRDSSRISMAPPASEYPSHPFVRAAQPTSTQSEVIKRELILNSQADETFTRLVEIFRRHTGTRLSSSHVARALFIGMGCCLDRIEREAKRCGRQKLPSNARGKEAERESFERAIARALIAGIRATQTPDDE